MSFYSFSREQLEFAVEDTKFQDILKFYFDKIFTFDCETFKGDIDIFHKCKVTSLPCASRTQSTGNYEILKHYSMPYLSPCVYQSNNMTDVNGNLSSDSDEDTRNKVLSNITSKYCISYWALLHQCVDNSIFIIYPICKLLWPEQKFYILDTPDHCVVINQEMYITLCNALFLPLQEERKQHNLMNKMRIGNNNNDDTVSNQSFYNLKMLWENNPEFTTNINSPIIFDFISPSVNYNRQWIFDHVLEGKIINEEDIVTYMNEQYGYNNFPLEEMKHVFSSLIGK